MSPVSDRGGRNPERCLFGEAHAIAARRRVLPREEREDRAGMTLLVAVIEMIGGWIVEIDGLLHQPQPERAGVEVDVC
jgi:hypothetical protein